MEPYLDPPPAPRPLIAPPARGPVVVLAPHPDDEWIGPGGTLLLHRARGERVHIVVVTDGAGDGGARTPAERTARAAARAAESRAFAAELGASVELLGHPDGRRAREEDLGVLVPQLAAILARERPGVVYAPHRDETHGDHHVVALAASRALARWRREAAAAAGDCELWAYEVWGTLAADAVVDVSPVMERKLALARCFPSQLRHTAITHAFAGLNAWRSAFLPKGATHGEGFRRIEPDERAR
jgi:LmbE family N-acetylglucosaminyl deacetylase